METTLQNMQLSLLSFTKDFANYRIKHHLRRVEISLRTHTPAGLSVLQLKNRKKTLDNLNSYWQAGEFPINDKVKHTTPVFKDEYGNFCAVGYLLSQAGFNDIITEVQSQNNYIRVKEISNPKQLAAISSLGITKAEAARIQPGYGFEDPSFYNDGSAGTVSILKILSVGIFIMLQLIAYLCVKEMNMSKAQKFLSFFTLFLFSSLIMIGIWSLLLLINI